MTTVGMFIGVWGLGVLIFWAGVRIGRLTGRADMRDELRQLDRARRRASALSRVCARGPIS